MRPIEDIAREAGCERLREWAAIGPVQRAAVETFAAIVRAEALEEAAEIADDMDYGLGAIAQTIRELKDTK